MEQRIKLLRSTAQNIIHNNFDVQQKRWPGYYNTSKPGKLKITPIQRCLRTPDHKNTTQCEHLMVKNVIPIHQKQFTGDTHKHTSTMFTHHDAL